MKRKWITVLLISCMCLGLIACTGEKAARGTTANKSEPNEEPAVEKSLSEYGLDFINLYQKDFATPDELLIYFAKGIAENDLSRVMGCFYLHHDDNSFTDFQTLESLQSYSHWVKSFGYTFLLPEDTTIITADETSQLADISSRITPENLNSLKLISIDDPPKALTAENKESIKESLNNPDIEDVALKFALFEFDDIHYYFIFQCAQYNDNWFICNKFDQTGASVSLPEKVSPDKYKTMIAKDISPVSYENGDVQNPGQASIMNLQQTFYATPEEALQGFIDSIKANDTAGMLSSCAINKYSQPYDLALAIQETGIYDPYNMAAFTEYPYYSEINNLEQLGALSTYIGQFYRNFNWIAGAPDNDREAIGKMNIRQISLPKSENDTEEATWLALYKKQAESEGALDKTERIVLFEYEDQLLIGGLQFLQYEDGWTIDNFSSPRAYLDMLIPLTDESEYLELIQ